MFTPIRVVIVEDQPHIRRDVITLVRQEAGFSVVGVCTNVADAKEVLQSLSFDLLLLDISLPDGTGFDVLNDLPVIRFKIIFLTAHDHYALQAIKVGAVDYLLKPINKNEFTAALKKVFDGKQQEYQQTASQEAAIPNVSDRIVVVSQNFIQFLELDDIMYCQSENGYTTFYLADGRKSISTKYLKEFENILPTSRFIRPHQSYLVNRSFIDQYRKDGFLILKNGSEIPVAGRRREDILQELRGLY